MPARTYRRQEWGALWFLPEEYVVFGPECSPEGSGAARPADRGEPGRRREQDAGRSGRLRWELERQPLGDSRWEANRLLPVLRRILADGDPPTQRALFAEIGEAARRAGHDEVLDSWGTDLRLLRPS